jgi:hypothetical protein
MITWSKEELQLCAIVYRRAGAVYAARALELAGWFRTATAVRDKMRKLNIFVEKRK